MLPMIFLSTLTPPFTRRMHCQTIDPVSNCDGGWYGRPSVSLTMKGPGVVTLGFGNCGAEGSVIVYKDDVGQARAAGGESSVTAFEIGDTALVKLESTPGSNAIIRVVKVVVHCTGGRRTGAGAGLRVL